MNDILFCQRREDGELRHFYGCAAAVAMCGVLEREIVKVKLMPDEDGAFWCWHHFEHDTYSMVYPNLVLLEMCFPYGIKAEEDFGRGHRVRVRAEIQGESQL